MIDLNDSGLGWQMFVVMIIQFKTDNNIFRGKASVQPEPDDDSDDIVVVRVM